MEKKNNIGIDLTLCFLILISAAFLLYPTIALEWNKRTASEVVTDYQNKALSQSEEEYEILRRSSEEYNQLLLQKETDRWNPSQGMHKRYEKELRLSSTNVMGSIEIPGIGLTCPIYHGTEDKVLQSGIGHLEGSSLPTDRPGSHCVLAGHRGLKNSELFTHLDKVEKGDHFIIRVLNKELYYKVDKISIVLPKETDYLKITEGMNEATLVTCTPIGVNTHRYLVHGVLTERPEVLEEEHPTININFWIALIVIVIYYITILVLMGVRKRKDPNRLTKRA